MEHLINEINQNTKRALEKIDDQSLKIAEVSVKVDLYRETQHEHAKKIDAIDKVADQSMQSTKAAHKRLDKIDGNVTWLWRTVVGGLIMGAIGLIFQYAKNGGM